jgi:hypothetical protein
VEKLIAANAVGEGETVVAVITGSGFREVQTASDFARLSIVTVTPADGLSTVERILRMGS